MGHWQHNEQTNIFRYGGQAGLVSPERIRKPLVFKRMAVRKSLADT